VDGGWVYDLCGAETPDQGVLLSRRLIEPLQRDRLVEYTDRRGMNYRVAVLTGTGALSEALLVAPPNQLPPRDWLVSLLVSRAPLSSADRTALLSGRPQTPAPAAGRIVCSCFNVGVNEIAAASASGCSTVEQIGARLGAGTNCGSCRSEIRKLLDENRLQAAE
jgi:assimilatory nitrate reductase catalytic subunit